MTDVARALCWAAALLLLALANYAGLIADKDAGVMFSIIPALWMASGIRGQRGICSVGEG